jgi:phosphocarrier protein FPr
VITLRLSDALHARPANLLVRLASQFAADVVVRKGTCRASAKNILEVLSLGAACGEEIVLVAEGEDADAALGAVRALIERRFDAGLVPEAGTGAVEGIAFGRAVVLAVAAAADEVLSTPAWAPGWTPHDEEHRLLEATHRVERDLEELVRYLPPEEAELFAPEKQILRELTPRILTRVRAGERAESAVKTETAIGASDLLLDARTLLLDALGGSWGAQVAAAVKAYPDEELVLVVDALPPSVVASLPKRVIGLVVAMDDDAGLGAGYTSHAAILARGREIPLAFMAPTVIATVSAGDRVLLDTTASPARLWVSPADDILADAVTRREERSRRPKDESARVDAPLLCGAAVRVNIGSQQEAVPLGADGIGLVRTELLFAGRGAAPSEGEQYAVLMALAKKADGKPIVVRLFDAGGDKPLAWIPPPPDDPLARGIALLLRHPALLEAQLRAIARAHEAADVRVLLPLVRSADDVRAVRACAAPLVPAGRRPLAIGAMIETREAVRRAGEIAEVSDFLSIGTNDLSAEVLGVDRAAAQLTLDRRVFEQVRQIVDAGHVHRRRVTVCGEIASVPEAARVLVGIGVDALSVAPARLTSTKLSLIDATMEDCRRAARAALLVMNGKA